MSTVATTKSNPLMRVLSSKEWGWKIGFAACAALLLFVAPYFLTEFRLGLLAKYLCFAIAAIGVAVAWGRGGMLVLGQGLFFGLGGYAMAMHLKLSEAGGKLPDFMTWSGVEKLPALWVPFKNPVFAIAAAIIVPVIVATILGLLIFRSRIRGPYFAILTQGLAAAFVILLVGQQGLTGGTNGLTNFTSFFGLDLDKPADKQLLYILVVLMLGASFLLARQLFTSRYGQLLVAVRDAEDRVRFLGYNPTLLKVVAFAFSAALAGLAGALFVPVVGIMSPALLGVVPSIEIVIWAAVGGRTSLPGVLLGAVLVNFAQTNLSERFPSFWLYLQGLLFIIVVAFAPKGLAGLGTWLKEKWAQKKPVAGSPTPATAAKENA